MKARVAPSTAEIVGSVAGEAPGDYAVAGKLDVECLDSVGPGVAR